MCHDLPDAAVDVVRWRRGRLLLFGARTRQHGNRQQTEQVFHRFPVVNTFGESRPFERVRGPNSSVMRRNCRSEFRTRYQEDLRGVLRNLLTGAGYTVIEAADGEAG